MKELADANPLSGLISRYRTTLLKLLALNACGSVLSGLSLLLAIPLLQHFTNDAPGRSITQALAAVGLTPTLEIMSSLLLAAVVVQAVLFFTVSVRVSRIHHQFVADLKFAVYQTVVDANWFTMRKSKKSNVVFSLTSDIDNVALAAMCVPQLAILLMMTLVYSAISLYLAPVLVAIAFGCVACVLMMLRTWNRQIAADSNRVYDLQRDYYCRISDQTEGFREVKSFGLEAHRLDEFKSLVGDHAKLSLDRDRLTEATSLVHKVSAATVGITLLVLGSQIFQIPSAHLAIVLVALYRLMPKVKTCHLQYQNVLRFRPAFESLSQTLKMLDSENAPRTETAANEPFTWQKSLQLRSISIALEETQVLTDVNLTICKNETIAIVGPSGCGKSTLANIMTGLLKPDRGEIYLDDDIMTEPLRRRWRHSVGYVPQEPFFHNGTLRDNMRWAKAGASDREIFEVLELVDLDAFVKALAGGLDTSLGDFGSRLSGGQRQRIALARVLLRDPQFLILDEATNAIDEASERLLHETLSELSKHRSLTVVYITHRSQATRFADRVISLSDGVLRELDS